MVEDQVTNLKKVCENKLCDASFRNQTLTFEKEAKRKMYCPLFMARGSNHEGVWPLIIFLKRKRETVKKEKVKLESNELDDDMMHHVDTIVDYDKSFKKHDLQIPLLWELHRTE